MRIGFANLLHQLCWLVRRFSARFVKPINVLRLCRRRTEFVAIVTEAKQNTPPWAPDLVDRVVGFVFEEGNSDLSVYGTATTDPLDHDHALGVIAEGITQKDFQKNERKRATGCTRGTLLIPTSLLPRSVRLLFTPQNNLNFFPANDLHYDLFTLNTRELASAILDGIHNEAIRCAFLSKGGSYQVQAAIAYSFCLSLFGSLDQAKSPSQWQNGINLTSADQIEILKHLAKVPALDSPLQ